MQGNGEQKGGLKDRKISWRIRKKKEKLQKQLKKQEQKEKERQLKIKNSQVFSNQTGRVKQKTESAFLVVFLLIGSLFSSPAKKKEKHDIKRFEKNKEEAPAALLYLKQDVKDYTESLDRYLNTIGRQIDLATEQKEIEEIKTRLDEIEDRFTQTKEKYEIIKQRHHIEEKESMLGLTKTKEVHVEGLSLEARQSVLASTAFITASLENSSEKIKQARTELEVKAKEFHIEPEEVLEENKVVATIHAGKEKIEITEKPFQKKNVIARPQEAVNFLKEKNEMMSKYEERIEAIHRASFDETHIEVLESYLKELIKMNEDLNQTLSEYKEKQEKYNIHGLIAFEDIRSFDRYRLTVSDVKIREILRHTTGEKENIEDCIKEQKEKMEKKESKEQEVKKEIEQQEEKEVDDTELLSTEEMENSIEKIRALLKKQEEVLSDFHTTLQKSSVRVRKESHFGRFRHLLSSFASMASISVVGRLLNIVHEVADGADALEVVLAYLAQVEHLLDRHAQLDHVEAVGVQIVGEAGVTAEAFGVDNKLLCHQVANLLVNHFVSSISAASSGSRRMCSMFFSISSMTPAREKLTAWRIALNIASSLEEP